jgi:hypothetical protein
MTTHDKALRFVLVKSRHPKKGIGESLRCIGPVSGLALMKNVTDIFKASPLRGQPWISLRLPEILTQVHHSSRLT